MWVMVVKLSEQICFWSLFSSLECQMVAASIRDRIEEFRPHIPLIQALRSPGMRSRHWETLSERIQITVQMKANLTFSRCIELGLQNHVDDIAQVAEVAGKEYTIEQVHCVTVELQREADNGFKFSFVFIFNAAFISVELHKEFYLLLIWGTEN